MGVYEDVCELKKWGTNYWGLTRFSIFRTKLCLKYLDDMCDMLIHRDFVYILTVLTCYFLKLRRG